MDILETAPNETQSREDTHPVECPVTIDLPHAASRIMQLIEREGGECWVVGGYLRDSLLGHPSHDIDIASSLPAETASIIFERAGYRVVPTGIAHGTITILTDDGAIELTTFRTEAGYSDGRHPDHVEFIGDIAQDLARRDFTINAMAYHPRRGFIDPFGGMQDLHSRLIRTVGNPRDRFEEDALRVLRACRFSAQLGFTIEDNTFYQAGYCKRYLHLISAQRVADELTKLLCAEYVHDALMVCIDLLGPVLPEISACKGFQQHNKHHIYDVLEHIAYVVQNTPPDPVTRWAALFHDAGKPATYWLETYDDGSQRGHFFGHAYVSEVLAFQALMRLKMPSDFIAQVRMLVLHHDTKVAPDHRGVRKMLRTLGGDTELFLKFVDLKVADERSKNPLGFGRVYAAAHLKDVLAEVLSANEAFDLKGLAIDGNDLIAAGFSAGPEIGRLLDACLTAVIEGDVLNERSALLELACGCSAGPEDAR